MLNDPGLQQNDSLPASDCSTPNIGFSGSSTATTPLLEFPDIFHRSILPEDRMLFFPCEERIFLTEPWRAVRLELLVTEKHYISDLKDLVGVCFFMFDI